MPDSAIELESPRMNKFSVNCGLTRKGMTAKFSFSLSYTIDKFRPSVIPLEHSRTDLDGMLQEVNVDCCVIVVTKVSSSKFQNIIII